MTERQTQPSPSDLQASIKALTKEIGPKCEITVYVGIHFSPDPLYVSVSPKGWTSNTNSREQFSLGAQDWAGLFENIRTEWAKRSDLSRTQTIRDMALAIIRITADLGQCTDAALRAEFDATDVQRYGEEACTQADELAANGPFEITATAGANAQAAA